MIRTCSLDIPTFIAHYVDLPPCCPVSGNPLHGSNMRVCYMPAGVVFPVEDLVAFIDEYRGGHDLRNIRNMEEMIQDLAARVCDVVGVNVRVVANLIIKPPFGGDQQQMRVSARAHTKAA